MHKILVSSNTDLFEILITYETHSQKMNWNPLLYFLKCSLLLP